MPPENCRKYVKTLSAYMDGEIRPDEAEELGVHLSSCPDCASALADMRAVESRLKARAPAEAPPFFTARVAAAAAALKPERTSLLRLLRLTVPAAAALSAFILLNVLTFAFNASALESSQRGELAKKAVSHMLRPASVINPVAVARLCGECSAYMCGCMHEAGKKSLCPCKSCDMERAGEEDGDDKNEEGHNVR